MKTLHFLFLLVTLAPAPFALAQDEPMGAVKATTRYLEGGAKMNTVVDPDQRTAVETVLDAKDRLIRKTVYVLDERNFALGAIHYDSKGNIRYKESYKRDLVGHVVESSFTNADGQSLGRRVFNYNGDKFTGGVDYDAQGNTITQAKGNTATTGKSAVRKVR